MDNTSLAMTAEVAVESMPSELPVLEAKLAKPRLRAAVIPRARACSTRSIAWRLAS
jgi:hypothetical protein